ncbi:hypothetical protein CLOM_g7438 [Closterium sp. NIES-68]|nr:hypothetical protein CLOM_g7438 [Closterium sp. NIES-68]GJP81034.1 hypothetical protein CLOP_g11215 [Closterium sp. NIES-67]
MFPPDHPAIASLPAALDDSPGKQVRQRLEDIETRILESKLQWLATQRQLSAVRCRHFMDLLRATVATDLHHQHHVELTSGGIDSVRRAARRELPESGFPRPKNRDWSDGRGSSPRCHRRGLCSTRSESDLGRAGLVFGSTGRNAAALLLPKTQSCEIGLCHPDGSSSPTRSTAPLVPTSRDGDAAAAAVAATAAAADSCTDQTHAKAFPPSCLCRSFPAQSDISTRHHHSFTQGEPMSPNQNLSRHRRRFRRCHSVRAYSLPVQSLQSLQPLQFLQPLQSLQPPKSPQSSDEESADSVSPSHFPQGFRILSAEAE